MGLCLEMANRKPTSSVYFVKKSNFMDNFDRAGAIVPGAEAEEPFNGKHENSHGFCTVDNILKDDDCTLVWIQ